VALAIFSGVLLVLNCLCWSTAVSEFPQENYIDHWVVLSLCLLVSLLPFMHAVYRERGNNEKMQVVIAHAGKRGLFFAVVYLLMIYPVYRVGHVAVYPGEVVDFEIPTELFGEEFELPPSTLDGAVLKGYHETFPHPFQPITSATIPVVFYGGNGQTMYSNTGAGHIFVSDAPAALKFDVYTLSWRGYQPNRGGLASEEDANIGDALNLYKYVAEQFPGRRPIVVSHSLGTGAAAAVAAHLSTTRTDQPLPACLGLGMPYSTMAQTTLEVAYYTSLVWLYMMPQWNTIGRISRVNDTDIPLAILSSGLDELIAPHHQKEIFEAALATDKFLFYSPSRNHNDIHGVIRDHLRDYTAWLDQCISNV
jgi:pimeloyl-ACP methyl ester carboxylesterase